MLTLRGGVPHEDRARQPLCAHFDGFSLHAAVPVEAHDRKRLEQLCRYITRHALSDKRIMLNTASQVELKLRTPWRDGTTHLVMRPLKTLQRPTAPQQWSTQHMTEWPDIGPSPAAAPGRDRPTTCAGSLP